MTHSPLSKQGSSNSYEPLDTQKVLKSQSTMSMIAHLHDILDAIIDSVLGKLNGMPFILRYFLKILYQECMKKYHYEQ
jgi:hypothetical protein